MISEAVEFLARSLVNETEAVKVEQQQDDLHQKIKVNIRVADTDYGRIIGRNGRAIKAIRTLAGLIGRQKGYTVYVDVSEPEQNRKQTSDSNDSRE